MPDMSSVAGDSTTLEDGLCAPSVQSSRASSPEMARVAHPAPEDESFSELPEELSLYEHTRYCFPDGNIVFKVENVLFVLHRYQFTRNTSWFSSKFHEMDDARPEEPGWESISCGPDGAIIYVNYQLRQTRTTPPPKTRPAMALEYYELKNVSVREFEAFLSVLYPNNGVDFEIESLSDWAAVLRLSSTWKFDAIRKLALDQLDPLLEPYDRLILARIYGFQSWVLPALEGLVRRERTLSRSEINDMDAGDIATIMEARERYYLPFLLQTKSRAPTPELRPRASTPASTKLPHSPNDSPRSPPGSQRGSDRESEQGDLDDPFLPDPPRADSVHSDAMSGSDIGIDSELAVFLEDSLAGDARPKALNGFFASFKRLNYITMTAAHIEDGSDLRAASVQLASAIQATLVGMIESECH